MDSKIQKNQNPTATSEEEGAKKGKMKVKVAQLCPTLCDPMDCTAHGILQARILKWVAFPFSGDLPNPGIEPRSSSLQADSLLAEPGKPKNVGVASLSLLQGIFPTQESNSGLLHCRRILYQMSHQGSPGSMGVFTKSPVHHSLATSDKQNDLLAPQPVGEGNDTPLQYSCLENPMGGGAW